MMAVISNFSEVALNNSIVNRPIPSSESGLMYLQSKPIAGLVNKVLYQFRYAIWSFVVQKVSKFWDCVKFAVRK